MIQNLNDIAGYELTTSSFVENRWPRASFVIIYDANVKEVINFRLQTDRSLFATNLHSKRGECRIIYRSDSKAHGSLGGMKFNGTQNVISDIRPKNTFFW